MLRNIFFDRDGIINEVVMRGEVVGSPRTADEFVIREDFVRTYNALRENELNMFVISNQPDVARGKMPQSELDSITKEIESRFAFKEVVYCTHDDKHECDCRKPKPGMIIYLLGKYGLEAAESILVGDSPKDILAGKSAGVRTVLLSTVYNRHSSIVGDFCVSRLEEILSLKL